MGEPVVVKREQLSSVERAKYDAGMQQHGFSSYVSDIISLRRRVKDRRHEL